MQPTGPNVTESETPPPVSTDAPTPTAEEARSDQTKPNGAEKKPRIRVVPAERFKTEGTSEPRAAKSETANERKARERAEAASARAAAADRENTAITAAIMSLELRVGPGGLLALNKSGKVVPSDSSKPFLRLVRQALGEEGIAYSDAKIRKCVDAFSRDGIPLYQAPPAPGSTGAAVNRTTNWPEPELLFERGDHVELAIHLLRELKGTGPDLVFDEGALYRYDPTTGLWLTIPLAEQSWIVQACAGAQLCRPDQEGPPGCLDIKAADVNGASKLAGHRAFRADFFANAPHGLVFGNGFLQVSEDGAVLHPHAPVNRARLGYAFHYVRNTAPQALLKFLGDAFRDDADRDEKILFTQEYFGGCLFGFAPTYQRAVMATGEGSNAKSKYGDIFLAAMPARSTCSVAPQLFESEYRRALLANKLLNVVNELPDADIIASEQFKLIVTGEPTDARHIREAPFTFRPIAGHLFACNRPPGTSDTTAAFWRRWIVIAFNRSFENDPACDPLIAEKIINTETPRIVSWLVEGAVRLLRQGKYTIPPSHDQLMRAWRKTADVMVQFLTERTSPAHSPRPDPGKVHDWTAARALYEAYTQWAQRSGHRIPMASNKFGSRMREVKKKDPPVHTELGWFYPVTLRRADEPDEPLTDYEPSPSAKAEGAANA